MNRITLTFFFLLFFPFVSHARWIGEYARDYSWREEKARIARDAIAAQRAEHLEARKTRRTETRTRNAPTKEQQPAPAVTNRRDEMLLLRLERLKNTTSVRRGEVDIQSSLRMDARRRSDLQHIINVLMPAMLDAASAQYSLIPVVRTEICKTIVPECGVLVDLDEIIRGSELASFPVDPEVSGDAPGTGYFVQKISANGRIGLAVDAPRGNGGERIRLEWIPVSFP